MDRIIFHIDMNSFYASVELLSYPKLRDKPVVVGGDPEARHGIVLAKNQQAKRLGIETAETLYSAKQKAPQLIVLPPHRERYREASEQSLAIYCTYTDYVESYSLDEAWLDVTHHPSFREGRKPAALALEIKERIKRELGLTVSIGVSWNKTFAKLGSDYRKPDAVTVIDRENYQTLLYPLPVERMLYVGAATAKILRRANLNTIGDLADLSPPVLASLPGKAGKRLARDVRGLDREPVLRFDRRPPAKSLSNFRTFSEDVTDPAQLRRVLHGIAAELAEELKRRNLRAETLQLQLRWSDFEDISRQRILPRPSTEARVFYETAVRILEERIELRSSVRALGLGLSKLTSAEEPIQMSLFDLAGKKKESPTKALLAQLPENIRERLKPARELSDRRSAHRHASDRDPASDASE